MPNRILRDWTDSERVNELSVHAERFFVRLIMKADDFGRYTANIKLLKAALYPLLSDSIRDADITRWMTECQKSGLIVVYEVSSKPIVQIQNFNQRLRQSVEKYPPPPDGLLSASCGQLTVNSQSIDRLKRNEVETESETETEVAHVRAREAKKITKTKVEVAIELPFDSENFKAVWDKWKDYRLKEKRQKFKSQASELAQLKHLYDLAGGVEESAIEIIHQSIGNQWQGLFPLKNKSQNGHKSSNAGGNRIEAIWRT